METEALIDVRVETPGPALAGDLGLPPDAKGIVLFAHGSGSGRKSPRNREVAATFRSRGIATMLFDLLTPEEEIAEERTRHLRFDVAMLARRLAAATAWTLDHPRTRGLHVGYFGASTGAAAALVAAAAAKQVVRAVVSRGGRPDLAGESLANVEAPTLLLVGGADGPVIDLNQQALDELRCPKELVIVPGATHLFDEPGTLEEVARLAGDWFERHLV